MFPHLKIQESYRKAIDARDAEKIAELIRADIFPDNDNMDAMKEALQKIPFHHNGKEDPLWVVYLRLLDKQYRP